MLLTLRIICVYTYSYKCILILCTGQISHLFDNEGTVAFAMFMAIWGEFVSADLS